MSVVLRLSFNVIVHAYLAHNSCRLAFTAIPITIWDLQPTSTLNSYLALNTWFADCGTQQLFLNQLVLDETSDTQQDSNKFEAQDVATAK